MFLQRKVIAYRVNEVNEVQQAIEQGSSKGQA